MSRLCSESAFMNATANQTTFDLMDKLLNASALNNRSSRRDTPSVDPFRGVNIFDEPSQELLYDLEATDFYSDSQLATISAVSRNLVSLRAGAWRTSFDGFQAILSAANTTMSSLHETFNKAVDSVSLLVFVISQYQLTPPHPPVRTDYRDR